MGHAHFYWLLMTDMVESVTDPDWKSGGVYTALVLTRINSPQIL